MDLVATIPSRRYLFPLVLAAIERLPLKFTVSQLIEKCPTVGIDYIRKVLRQQRLAGKIKSTGRGPDAAWLKLGL